MTDLFRSRISLLVSSVIFALGGVGVKVLSKSLSPQFISFVRFFAGVVFTLAALRMAKEKFRVTNKSAWIGRGVYGAVSMVLYFVGIGMTSPGRASLLTNTYPAFVMVCAVLFFEERFLFRRFLSLIICLAGATIILHDGSRYSLTGDLVCLVSAALGGMAVNYIRVLRADHSPFVIYFSVCAFGLLGTMPWAGEAAAVRADQIPLLFIVAFFMFGGQILMNYSLRWVSATEGSLYSYITTPLIILLSVFLFQERITGRFILGALVIAGGLVLTLLPAEVRDAEKEFPSGL